MNRLRPSILGPIAAIAAVSALVAAALLMVPARATQPTPAPEVSTTILARSRFDPIQVKARTHTPEFWKAQLKTYGNPTSTSWTTSSHQGRAPAGTRMRVPA